MTQINFNLINWNAKSVVFLGGGNSQSALRHERTQKTASKESSLPMVNRRSTDSQSQGRYSVITPRFPRLDSLSIVSRQSDLRTIRGISALFFTRLHKYAAMITLLLTLSCGQAWGATTAPSDTVTVHVPGKVADGDLVSKWNKKYEVYFSNNASKTAFLVGSNTASTTQATGANKWCNIGSSVGNSDNNISTAFTVGEFVSNIKSSNNKALTLQSTGASEKAVVMVVSGYDSIATFGKSNDLSVYAEIWNGSSYGSPSELSISHTASGGSSTHYKRNFALDKTKRYRLTIAYGTSGTSNKYLVAFSLCYTPASCAAAPTAPTAFAKSSVTGTTATFSITDAADAASYDIYCSTSSTSPDGETTPTATGLTTKTPTVTSLTANTTYYAWVRAVCDESYKSSWLALTGSTFTTLQAISPSLTYANAPLVLTIRTSATPTLTGNTGSGAVTWNSSNTGVATVDASGNVSAVAAGTTTITASIAANGGYEAGEATYTLKVAAAPLGIVDQKLATGNVAWDASVIVTSDYTNITSLTALSQHGSATASGNGNTNNGGQTSKVATKASYSDDDYLEMSFTVASGKKLDITAVHIPVQPVTSDVNNFKAVLSDDQGSTEIEGTTTNQNNGTLADIGFSSYGELKGTITLRIYAWGHTNGYRLGKNIYITGTIEDDASCTAPDHVDISGDWDRFGGETISLTATAYDDGDNEIDAGDITGYQWQKYYNSTWNDIDGATSATYTKSNCDKDDSGSYRCVVSTGADCSTASDGYQVKVYVLECYNDGTTVYNFTRDGNNQRGSLTIDLDASTAYTFKVHADNDYYGNNGTINFDATNWVLCNNSTTACTTNLTVNSGLGGTFTFTMDYSTGGNSSVEGEPELSVTYPRKRIYLAPNSDWLSNSAKFAYYYFHKNGDDTDADGWTDFLTSDDCGTYADIPQWNGAKMIAVRFNSTKTSIGNWDDKWNQTDDLILTSNDLITITGWDNSQTYNSTYSLPTYTISYNAGTNGSGSKSDETKTCGVDFTLPSSAVFTRDGYTQTGWTTSDGGSQTHELGGSYTVNDDQTFYPVWTGKTYTITYKEASDKTTLIDVSPTSYTCGGGKITLPTPASRSCYTFDGWYKWSCVDTDHGGEFHSDCKRTEISNGAYGDYTFYGKWTLNSHTLTWTFNGGTTEDSYTAAGSVDCGETLDYPDPITKTGYTFSAWSSTPSVMPDNDLTLTASWTANNYTVTLDPDNGNSTTTVSATYDAAMPSKLSDGETDVAAPTFTGYTFGGYYDDHAGTGKQYYTNAVASANTWDKTSATTLYAKWTQTVTLKTGSQGSGSDLTPTVAYNGTALSGFSSGHTAKGYRLLGYYTASSEGTKVLNADGTFAASSVTDYITGGKWTKANATTLYAQWEDMEITLPGTLNKANNIETGGGLTFINDTLDYSHGDNNHRDGYAEWKVNVAQKCVYTVTINGNYTSTGRQWEMYLVNGSGTTISTRTFDAKYDTGDQSYTKNWDLSGIAATGTYIVRLKNTLEWGAGKVLSVAIDPIKVTYNANGGSCATEYAYYAGSALTLPTPTKDGYVFEGWYDGETKEGDAGDSYTPDASITLTAKWAIITDLPGTLDKDNYVEVGGGLSFDDDYFDYGTGTGSKLDGYAEWKVNVAQKCVYKVTLNGTYSNGHQWEVYLMDGSGSTEATCTIDKSYSTGDRTETKNWDLSSISATGTYTVRVMNILKDGEPKLLSVTIDPVTVTYDANGGTCATASAYYAGSALTLPTPTRAGYTFEGWYNAGTKKGDAGDDYTPDPVANITLYAHWTDNISGKVFSYIDGLYGDKYKAFDESGWVTSTQDNKDKTYTNATTGVQFVVDDGSWDNKTNVTAKAISSLAKFKNGTTSMSVVIPTGKIATVKIGYGAYNTGRKLTINETEQSAATTALADGLTNGEVDAALKEVTLSSQTGTLTLGSSSGNIYIGRVSATITGYVITYATGDYGSGDTFTATKTHGSDYTVSSTDDAFTRTNCVYDGWSVNSDGSTKDYAFGGTYSTDAPLTLYPHWVATCSTPDAPTGFSAGSITDGGVTFSITDAGDAGNYDIYYSTSSSAPIGSTEATTTATSKSKEVTGLTAGTTYYAWVRAVCDEDHKSDWVALNPDGDAHTFFTDYTISIGAVTTRQHDGSTVGGTISSDVSHAVEGGTVTLTATPTSGYGFVEWTIEKTSDNSDVTSSVLDDNTLTMPAYGVTVKAIFAKRHNIGYKDYDKTTVLDLSPTYYLYGTGVPELPTPTKTCYTFDSWYSSYCVDTQHSEEWDESCKKSSIGTSDYGSDTYYASWIQDNLAYQKTPVAGYEPGNANEHSDKLTDGSTSTAWTTYSDRPASEEWFYVDLGAVYQLSSIELVWGDVYSTDYILQVRHSAPADASEAADDSKWYTVAEVTDASGSATKTTSVDIAARYVRFHSLTRSSTFLRLYEFRVFGTGSASVDNTAPVINTATFKTASSGTSTAEFDVTFTEAVTAAADLHWTVVDKNSAVHTATYSAGVLSVTGLPTDANQSVTIYVMDEAANVSDGKVVSSISYLNPTENLALNKTSYACIDLNDSEGKEQANDGSTSTYMTTYTYATTDNEWWYVDLGDFYEIDSIDVVWMTDYASASYSVQYRQNAPANNSGATSSEWDAITEFTSVTTGNKSTSLASSVGARYICLRSTAHGSTNPEQNRLAEVRVYGSAFGTPDNTAPSWTDANCAVTNAEESTIEMTLEATDETDPVYDFVITVDNGTTSKDYEKTTTALSNVITITDAEFIEACQTYTVTAKCYDHVGNEATKEFSNVTPTPSTSTNIAEGKTATAGTTEDLGHPASNAVDGNTGTEWSGNSSEKEAGVNQWLTVDLGTIYEIGQIDVTWGANTGTWPQDYRIEVSCDGTNYATVIRRAEVSANQKISFSSLSNIAGRYVRIWADKYGVSYGMCITELEVYSAASCPSGGVVTLHTNGGTINADSLVYYFEGEGATLPTDVTREGYRFMGWYDNSGLTGDAVEEIADDATGDKEYWAKWAALYTITTGTHTNGSIAITNSSSEVITEAIAGETVSIAATAGTHCEFSEWSIHKTDDAETTVSPAAATASTSFTMPAYDVTVNATFAKEALTLTYAKGDATGDIPTTPAAGTIAYGTEITVPDKGGLVKSSDAFVGWLYNDRTLYTTGQKFTMTENVTLSAVWDSDCPASKTVLFKAQTKTSGLNAVTADIKAINGSESFTTSNYLSTLEGGTLTLTTTATNQAQAQSDSLVRIKATAYWTITLGDSKTLQAGDVIITRIKNQNGYLQKTSGAYSSSTDITLTKNMVFKTIVTNDMVGAGTLYIKASSDNMDLAYVEIYRPAEKLLYMHVNDGLTNGNIATDETQQTAGVSNLLDVVSGGEVYTGATTESHLKIVNTSEIQLSGNTGYLKLVLPKALAEGDMLLFHSSSNYQISFTTSKSYGNSIGTSNKVYTIPAASGLIGQSTIYVWYYSSSNSTNVKTLAVVRPTASGSGCKCDVSFANMTGFEGGATVTLPSDIEGVPVGKRIAQPADPTTTGDYVFGGWYSDAACTSLFSFSGMLTKDTTIYAKWYDADYTITWMVNGESYATTKACDEVTTITLPTAPADNTLDDCANSFRGWSETNLYGEANDDQPSDLFIDPADAPTIDGNKTFYAVFGTATDAAYVNTVLWSENWTGAANNSTPTTLTSGGYAAVGAVIGYTWVDGTGSSPGTSKVTNDGSSLASKPDAMIGKKGGGAGAEGGYLTISGIPTGGAAKVLLSYTQNANQLYVYVVGDGYSYSGGGTSVNSNTAGTKEHTIVCGTEETFTLQFKATTTSNVRIDDIIVKIKEDGATDYRCICPSLTLAGPSADLVFVTSTAEKTVRSQEAFTVSGTGLTKNADLTTGEFGNSKFAFKTAAGGTVSTDANGDLEETEVYVFYTPAADDDEDGLDEATEVTISIEGAGEATSNDLFGTKRIIGRHLPANFVIAAKNGDKWYALPADMSSGTPAPVEIAVDDINNPTVAYTASSNIYGLAGPTSNNISGGNGQYVRLTMSSITDGTVSAGPAPLHANSSDAKIGKSGTASAASDLSSVYWWLLTQTNASITNPQDAKYTIASPGGYSSYLLRAWFAAGGGPKWGQYSAGENTLRLIPASSAVFAEAEIVAWGKNSAIVEVDNSTMIADYAIAKLPEDIVSGKTSMVQTRTSVKNTGTRYNYTMNFGEGVDFSANEGKMLTLEWYDILDNLKAVSNILVPCIVAENITINKANYSNKSDWNKVVHVLPGDTVTIDASGYSGKNITIKELVIYPGARVIAQKDTLIVPTLVMRNGWNRLTAKTEYNVSQLYITPSTGSVKATNAYADWYIDYDQYYPIAVPWKVATANISYRNMTVDIADGLLVRYYNGERRAGVSVDGTSNWTDYTWGGGGTMPANLEPGIGYAITARRPAGKAFSIIRLPLTILSNAWTKAGEQGNVTVEAVTTHKDEVAVTAWAKDDGTTSEQAKGWNFVANPYMSSYEGEIAFTPDSDPGEEYEDEIAYVNIPDVNFKEFDQVAAATAELKPGCGFLIQTKYDGKITFATTSRKAEAPAYRTTTPKAPKQKAYILLRGDDAVDQMGLIIADRYTADYEVNADLEKLLSDGNTLRTYMQYNDLNMAYVAINSTLAQQWIPVSVRIPATGEYTYSIHRASRVSELTGLYLIDYTTYEVTNLLESDYVFTAAAGTITDRFAINAIYGPRDTPTDLDVVQGGGDIEVDHPIKFLYQDKIYIYYRGVIYDTNGKKVAERRAAL